MGAVYYLAKDLGIRNTRLEEGLKRLDEKQESERRERHVEARVTRAEAESAMLRVFTATSCHSKQI